jgi:hypothetical protein
MLFCGTNIFVVSEKSVVYIFVVKWCRFRGASARAADQYWFHQSVYPYLTFAVTETFPTIASLFFPRDGCSRFLQTASIYPSA